MSIKPCLFQAPPKAIPKTIENQRIYDETTVDPNDEEVTVFEFLYMLLTFVVVVVFSEEEP